MASAALDITFPGNLSQVEDAATLRLVPSAVSLDNDVFLVSDLGLFTFDSSSLADDDGETVIRPAGITPLQAGRWIAAGATLFERKITRANLSALKAAGARDVSVYDGSVWYWTLGNFTSQANDINVVKANSTALSIGAWVRQRADGVNFDGRAVSAKLAESVSITDARFAGGAKGDGSTDDTAAINAALAGGGRIIFPRGTYKITDRLLVTAARTDIVLEAGVTITGSPWRYQGAQLPFGSLFLITAADCSITGAGMGSSIIAVTGGSEANGITFLHCDGGSVSGVTLDGGRSAVTAVEDDTFMTGINVLNASVSRPAGTKWSRVQVSAVEARNWTQYGMQAYGDLAGAEFSDCWVHDNGITSQPISRGAGIAVTRGNRGVVVQRCTLESNKQDGIFQTSAGLSAFDIRFSENLIRNNGRWGITCTEEVNFASVANVGTNGLVLTGNIIRNNGAGAFDSKGGIRIGTYDGVGIMSQVTASGGLIQDNIGYGVLIQTNDNPTSRTANVDVDISVTGNTLGGIAVGAKIDDTVRWNSSKSRYNSGMDVVNIGDGRLISNARGLGVSVASAASIMLPIAGDVFIITGTTNIATIATAGNVGRRVTLIFGGSLTVLRTGNIVMLTDWVATGNDTLELVCAGTSWIKTGGEHNA